MVYKKMMNMKFTSDDIEDKNMANDDDSGYELDDSGMIPKLEELKAAGKKEDEESESSNVLLEEEKTFSEEASKNLNFKKDNLEESIVGEENISNKELSQYDLSDNEVMGKEDIEMSPLEEDFARSKIVEKDDLGDTVLFDYNLEDINNGVDDEDLSDDVEDFFEDEREEYINNNESFDFGNEEELKDLEKYDEDRIYNFDDEEEEDQSLEQQKFFSEDDFIDDIPDDLSDVKVKFYDDESASDSTDILSALDKIADRREILEAIDDAFLDVERFLDTMDRIADSLDRIADSLELIEK